MDGLLLFDPSKKSHMTKLEDLLKALLKSGLKISPQKVSIIQNRIEYRGNTIFIQDRRFCVKPLRSRFTDTYYS